MPDPNGQKDGAGASGDDKSAPPIKTVEEQLKELADKQTQMASELQSSREELKRVNNLNGVLMQRLNTGGNGDPSGSDGRGMDVNRTSPIKLKRDFSSMDPAADPKRFAEELVLETAEQVSSVIARNQEVQATNQNLRRSFYDKNKDLVGYEIEVGHYSSEVQAQNPGLPFDQASEIVAQRTRDYIKSKRLDSPADPNNPNPPHAMPPSAGGQDNKVHIKDPKGGKDEPYNPDKAYEEDMKDYAAMRNKERERTGTSSGKA